MKFETNEACRQEVEELVSNNDLSNQEVIETLRGKYSVQDIQVALSSLFVGKNKGRFDTSSGKTKRVI